MLPVISAVATAAPSVYDKANKFVARVTRGDKKNLKELIMGKDSNAPALAAEALVKSGLDSSRLKGLLVGFGVQNVDQLMAHVGAQVVAEAEAVSASNTRRPAVSGLTDGERDDVYCSEMKKAIIALGLTDADALMRVASVLNTLDVSDVAMYKRKGILTPALGYK